MDLPVKLQAIPPRNQYYCLGDKEQLPSAKHFGWVLFPDFCQIIVCLATSLALALDSNDFIVMSYEACEKAVLKIARIPGNITGQAYWNLLCEQLVGRVEWGSHMRFFVHDW